MNQSYIVRRVGQLLLTSLGVLTLVFFLIHLVPGDPVDLMLGDHARHEDKVRLREQLGLNLPVPEQYKSYLSGVVSGNLGVDILTQRPVFEVLIERVPNTFLLSLAALLVALTLSFPLGITSALHHQRWFSMALTLFSVLGMSLPTFCLGPLLIILLSVHWDLLPFHGFDSFAGIVLPALTMGLSLTAFLTRMIRASTLEVLKYDFVRVAHAKGLHPFWVIFKHVTRNALIPVVTVVGTQFGTLMAGAVITESIFDWPGLGLIFYQSFQQRNYQVIQGCVLFIALSTMTINFIVDLLYQFIDPRIKVGAA